MIKCFLWFVPCFFVLAGFAQKANYKEAERFMRGNAEKLVGSTKVSPHFLKESDSLDKLTDEEIKKEIFEDMDFYLQTSQGFAARLSMLASQITSTFGGTPAVTPPIFPFEKNEANGNDL